MCIRDRVKGGCIQLCDGGVFLNGFHPLFCIIGTPEKESVHASCCIRMEEIAKSAIVRADDFQHQMCIRDSYMRLLNANSVQFFALNRENETCEKRRKFDMFALQTKMCIRDSHCR